MLLPSLLLLILYVPSLLLCINAVAVENDDDVRVYHPSARKSAAAAANYIRALLQNQSPEYNNVTGSGTWGDRGDLMGLLVRLPFHDAATFRQNNITDATGGSDGCVDLDSAENNGLQEAIDILEPIRQKVNADVDDGGKLSRADLWALAGNVMIEEAGGPALEFKVGRKDAEDCVGQGKRHVTAESKSSEAIEKAFVDELGFTHREVVALLGAHVLGKATKKNSGYEGPWVRKNDQFTNEYFISMLHEPWHKHTENVEPFGERTTWKRFESMQFQKEIMLQSDVDLAFQTTGGYFCSRIGGSHIQGMSCPNATHGFSSHVRDFAIDEDEWLDEFAVAWAKLTSMTKEELQCVMPDCNTPLESWEDVVQESAAHSVSRLGKWRYFSALCMMRIFL